MKIFFFKFFIVLRDLKERGRDLENILEQYTKFVKPAFDEYILPVLLKKNLFNFFF